MKSRIAVGACAAAVLLIGSVVAEPLKSGLQKGAHVPVFHPLNVTGPFAGQKQCLV